MTQKTTEVATEANAKAKPANAKEIEVTTPIQEEIPEGGLTPWQQQCRNLRQEEEKKAKATTEAPADPSEQTLKQEISTLKQEIETQKDLSLKNNNGLGDQIWRTWKRTDDMAKTSFLCVVGLHR